MKTLELLLKHETAELEDPVFLEVLEDPYRGPKLLSVHRPLYVPKKERVGQRTEYSRLQQRTIVYLYDCLRHQLRSVEAFQGNFKDASFHWVRPRKDETKESAPDEQSRKRFYNYLRRVVSGLKDKRGILTTSQKNRSRERELCNYFIPLLENIVAKHAFSPSSENNSP